MTLCAGCGFAVGVLMDAQTEVCATVQFAFSAQAQEICAAATDLSGSSPALTFVHAFTVMRLPDVCVKLLDA